MARKKSKKKRLVLLLLICGLAVGGLFAYDRRSDQPTNQPAISNQSKDGGTAQNSSNASQTPVLNPDLVPSLNKIISRSSNLEIAVSVIDLDSGAKYDAGDTKKTFVAASITKILAAVGVLSEVDSGQTSLSKVIDGSSAGYLLRTMIQDSNNQSWHSLRDYLGDIELHSYAVSTGLRGFTGGIVNTLTAGDEARLLSELALGRLISSESRELLYFYMQNTSNDELIPAVLPSGAEVYHKYGLLDGNLHDAAIVSYKDHNFVLVILTNNPSGSLNYDSRVQLFHELTKTVQKALSP